MLEEERLEEEEGGRSGEAPSPSSTCSPGVDGEGPRAHVSAGLDDGRGPQDEAGAPTCPTGKRGGNVEGNLSIFAGAVVTPVGSA
jgi:hypothetical protein